MCGIAGFIDLSRGTRADEMAAIAVAMADALAHRGPDDAGVWADAAAGVALSHRRLSIIDLSPEGHQPMHSASGRYVITFNGEIYNFLDLRAELQGLGHTFHGRSDTEIILAATEQWGPEGAVKRFNGMFAYAIWDRTDQTLYLYRDRVGKKPLYYAEMGDRIIFGSELKSLKANPAFTAEIDRDALSLFLRHNYVPAPYSIYQGTKKLMPGTILKVAVGDRRATMPRTTGAVRRPIETTTYWSARDVAEAGAAHPFVGSPEEAADQLEALLLDAVKLRMVADVPLGAFLSGGIDSSTVVALMQAQSDRPVKTYTIGFHEQGYNEAVHAKAVAAHLGTEHTELYVTPEEARSVIPRLPQMYDEPFSDSSQIPTFLVSELARRDVTVSLSGDGGDELFYGYNHYDRAFAIWEQMQRIPGGIRRAAALALLKAPRSMLRGKPWKLGRMLSADDARSAYREVISHWREPASMVLGAAEPLSAFTDPSRSAGLSDFRELMMFTDLVSYLPDDILVKVDRASMAVSLEARNPLLDHRVVEFSWTLPVEMKRNGGVKKWPLRAVLAKHVPNELIERPKMGFGVPIDSWLRGPLREWGEELLSEDRLIREGIFDPAPIRRTWKEHVAGKADWQHYLWDILMFQAWLAEERR